MRRLLVEAAQSYTRGNVGHKSVALKQRQKGNPPEVIAYADKANERLRRRFYKMTLNKGVSRDVAATAIARELACFIWGMMTEAGKVSVRGKAMAKKFVRPILTCIRSFAMPDGMSCGRQYEPNLQGYFQSHT